MTTAIVTQLKTGTIKNVVPFGLGGNRPEPPYVVVKPESRLDGERAFRIIIHMKQGQNIFLEDYVFSDLETLLSNFRGVGRNSNNFRVYATEEYSDIITNNDDNTISMERVFIVPQRLY